jgi:hypothetical protein
VERWSKGIENMFNKISENFPILGENMDIQV